MEPTYHLEGVIRSKEEMEDFEGPLNLILMLLSKNKIEIRDIQISLILDQYLSYLEQMQEMDLEVASEFVQMASHLVYIKTKTLLTGEEEVSELENLMSSLEQLKCRDMYVAIRAVTPQLEQAADRGMLLFSCPGEVQPKYGEYRIHHTKSELLGALLTMFGRNSQVQQALQPRPLIPQRITYGVREKGKQLVSWLQKNGAMHLSSLYAMSHSRSEVVATFLAILELCSAGSLLLHRGENEQWMVSFSEEELDTDAILEGISE